MKTDRSRKSQRLSFITLSNTTLMLCLSQQMPLDAVHLIELNERWHH